MTRDMESAGEFEPPSGYCENGIHYIGDAEECERCRIMEERRRRAREADR